MMITYPLSHPPRPYFRSVTFSLVQTVAFTESPFSLQRQYQRHQGDRWQASVELPPMTRAEAQAWIAFLLALKGGTGTFLLTYPETSPLGYPAGSPMLDGTHSAGVEELVTTGWTPGTEGILRAGDMIQIGSGAATGLYQVLQDVDAGPLGEARVDIAPRLRANWSSGTALITSNVQGLFRLAQPIVEYTLDDLRFYGLAFDCVEALPTAA